MANVNRPSGFTPLYYLNGSPWNGQARTYSIDANYGTALYIGDPVISGGGADSNGVPNIAIGATTGALRGVIVGLGTSEMISVNPLNLNITYRPASDPNIWYAKVVDDPNVIFGIQEHGAAGNTQLTAAEVGLNQIGYSGTAGNGYLSGWQLGNTTDGTANTTATLQLRLMGLQRVPNNAFGAYAKWLVKINVHELGTGTGAAGV
jgi:hypothetical protein